MNNLVNQVATAAAKIKSVSKVSAFDTLKSLISDGKLSVEDATKLYKHFMPKTAGTPKTLEAWVSKILPKNDVRYYINYLTVTELASERVLVATDGHRLHYISTDLDLGSYDGALNLIDSVVSGYNSYPKFQSILWGTSLAEKTIPISDYKEWLLSQERMLVKNQHLVILETENGTKIGINEVYLSDALCSNDNQKIFIRNNYHDNKYSQSIMIKGDSTTAIIMPVTIE